MFTLLVVAVTDGCSIGSIFVFTIAGFGAGLGLVIVNPKKSVTVLYPNGGPVLIGSEVEFTLGAEVGTD
jgi:hypothetical protein